jgi:hypothetical protein
VKAAVKGTATEVGLLDAREMETACDGGVFTPELLPLLHPTSAEIIAVVSRKRIHR